MIWLLNDFDLLSTLLHAATLSLEALLAGGVFFLLITALPGGADERALRVCRRGIEWAALAMFLAETASMAVETTLVVGNSGMTVSQAMNGGPLVPQLCAALAALLLLLLARYSRGTLPIWKQLTMLASVLVLIAAAVALSHAVSRMDHRLLLTAFTALHHLGTAAWIGGMPFLLIALKRTDDVTTARRIVGRFSRMAMVSVALLLGAGIGLAWFYVGSPSGLYGTTYGVLVMVKACLLLLILLLGASNWYVQRGDRSSPGTTAHAHSAICRGRDCAGFYGHSGSSGADFAAASRGYADGSRDAAGNSGAYAMGNAADEESAIYGPGAGDAYRCCSEDGRVPAACSKRRQ